MTEHLEVRRGAYADSVSLMQVSRRVADVAGIEQALVAMATELNLGLLAGMGFDAVDAGPNDLVVAVRGRDQDAVDAALAELQAALAASRGGGAAGASFGDGPPPRTVRDAAATLGAAEDRAGDLALVSVPGEHAYLEALDALRAGLHVMVFSDNVPLDAEVALKREAGERGLLVMGPDAGTAIVAGVGLGFANVVQPGPVGVVAASGTGAQHLTCLLDDAGVGVSHVLGVGGRDLSADVAGASTLQALRALDADPGTETIVVLSKPPDEQIGARVREAAEALDTPVVFAMLGPGEGDLTAAAAEVARACGAAFDPPRSWPAQGRRHPEASGDGAATGTASASATDTGATGESGAVGTAGVPGVPGVPGDGGATDSDGPAATELRALFAGGTLCQEATLLATEALGQVASNVRLPGTSPLTDGLDTPGHLAVDLGEDEYTLGRPHPMIDQSLRIERIDAEAARPGPRVLLLDVVLGHGAHPDPAAELAPAISRAITTAESRGERLDVVVALCASAGDPQGRERQAEALVAAGASVHLSNAAAAREAIELIGVRP